MKRWRLVRCVWLVFVLSAAVANSQEPTADETVGDYGDCMRWELQGLRSFEPDMVRNALFRDFELSLATHPLARLERLPSVFEKRLLAGLRDAGHVDAEVSVQIDRATQRLRATIQEGPCFLCGPIDVQGVDSDLSQRLIRCLTEPYLPDSAVRTASSRIPGRDEPIWVDKRGKPVDPAEPVWQIGKPARFAGSTMNRIHEAIKEAFADLGLRSTRFRLEIDPDRNLHTARLVVFVNDVGPVSRVQRIEIAGNERNTRERILAYLQIGESEPLTRALLTRLDCDLWRSGRFASVEVGPLPSAEDPGPPGVKIDVVESKYAPLLNEPLSPAAELLLKTREMLVDPTQWPADLLMRYVRDRGVYELMIHPQQGLLLVQRTLEGEFRSAVAVSQNFMGYYSARLPVLLESPLPALWLRFAFGYELSESADDDDKPFKVSLQYNFRTDRPEWQTLPLEIGLNADPAMLIALANLPGVQVDANDDRVVVASQFRRLEVDSRDGRLVSYIFDREGEHLTLTFQAGVYDAAWEEIRTHTGNASNVFDAARPVSSIMTFFCQAPVLIDIASQLNSESEDRISLYVDVDALTVLHRLLDLGILQPLDQIATTPRKESGVTFRIPGSKGARSSNWLSGDTMARIGVPFADNLFARNSWMWTVWRESFYAAAGQTRFTSQQLQRLYDSPELGPMGCLAICHLLSHVDNKAIAERFAARGLRRANTDGFRSDYAPLLDREYPIGSLLHQTAEILGNLTPWEAEKLAQGIRPDLRPLFLACATEFREHREKPAAESLPLVLDQVWNAGLRELTIAQLNRYLPRDAFPIPPLEHPDDR